jgi:hypothetical protein
MLSSVSCCVLGAFCILCRNSRVSSIDKCRFPSQWLVFVASIVLHTYCHGECCSYCCSIWSIALHHILGVPKSVSIGTSHNSIFCGMALVASSLIASWVHGNTHLAISHTFDIGSGACHSAWHARPRIHLGSSIPSSSRYILSFLVWPSWGFMHLVGVLLILRAASYLAVIVIQHTNPLHHHLLGNCPEVSWESYGAAPS